MPFMTALTVTDNVHVTTSPSGPAASLEGVCENPICIRTQEGAATHPVPKSPPLCSINELVFASYATFRQTFNAVR